MLEAEFNAGTSVVKVNYWACSREEHQNDSFHYHFALKLTGSKKWLSVKNKIAEKHGIQVSFSGKHNFCLCPYKYVCKSDQEVAHSETTSTRAFGSCFSRNQKVNCRISYCLCDKKEVHRRRIFLWCCKEAKKFDQSGFSRVHSRKRH